MLSPRFPRVGVLCTLFLILCLCSKVYALDSLFLELGSIEGDEEAERYGGAFRYAPEKRWLESNNWYLSTYFEFGVAYWDGEFGTEGEDSLVDFGLTPVLRYQRSVNSGAFAPFFEFGTGVHAHTETGIGAQVWQWVLIWSRVLFPALCVNASSRSRKNPIGVRAPRRPPLAADPSPP
jgi:hypothetical protein